MKATQLLHKYWSAACPLYFLNLSIYQLLQDFQALF